MSGRTRAYIGLGANLGDAEATLAAAVVAIGRLPGVRLRGVSRLYATVPVGLVDQPEFRNAVVAVDVSPDRSHAGDAVADGPSGALDLLVRLKSLERDFGRRAGRRWGPRELDLDLLVFGRSRFTVRRPPAGRSLDPVRGATPDGRILEVPHPSAERRSFVLAPLLDLAPGLVPPGWHRTVRSAARRQAAVEGPDAVRAVAAWEPARQAWRPLERR
jgi:2-amino-4-hydroxy-6-hydroxymethyldihydropteridine diphosphokinase